MRTNWEAGRQAWEIFIDDPRDPALAEFGFPDTAREYLENPGAWVERLAPVEGVSRRFFARLKRHLERGDVHVLCLADAADTYSGKYPDVVREGYAHYALLGPDWTDQKAWTRSQRIPEWVNSVCLPLRPWCKTQPSWQDFTEVPKEVRTAFERLAGLLMSGVSSGICPVIAGCSDWPRSDPEFIERIRTSPNLPVQVEPGESRVWTLQHNYYGVETHVVAPGHIVLTDGRGGLQVLTDVTPGDWLASELEKGTRGQPDRANRRWTR